MGGRERDSGSMGERGAIVHGSIERRGIVGAWERGGNSEILRSIKASDVTTNSATVI